MSTINLLFLLITEGFKIIKGTGRSFLVFFHLVLDTRMNFGEK